MQFARIAENMLAFEEGSDLQRCLCSALELNTTLRVVGVSVPDSALALLSRNITYHSHWKRQRDWFRCLLATSVALPCPPAVVEADAATVSLLLDARLRVQVGKRLHSAIGCSVSTMM